MNQPTRRAVRGAAAKSKRVLGIDPSLLSTGFAYRIGADVYSGAIDPGKLTGPKRLSYVKDRIAEIVAYYQPDFVAYEDYAKGKGGMGRTFDIGELGGVLKTFFHENGIDVMLVSPTALKKAITGRGDADKAKLINGKKKKDPSKPEMRAALLNTFGIGIDQGDAADACGLMLMGEMRNGSHTVSQVAQSKLRLDSLRECVIIQGRRRG